MYCWTGERIVTIYYHNTLQSTSFPQDNSHSDIVHIHLLLQKSKGYRYDGCEFDKDSELLHIGDAVNYIFHFHIVPESLWNLPDRSGNYDIQSSTKTSNSCLCDCIIVRGVNLLVFTPATFTIDTIMGSGARPEDEGYYSSLDQFDWNNFLCLFAPVPWMDFVPVFFSGWYFS